MVTLFKKLKNNRKSNAWAYVYALSFLFALGILYTTFLYVFEGQLVPTIKGIANTTLAGNPAAIADINSGIDKYMVYFKIMPFVLFFVTIIYMIATTLYKQSGGQYYP